MYVNDQGFSTPTKFPVYAWVCLCMGLHIIRIYIVACFGYEPDIHKVITLGKLVVSGGGIVP